MGILDSIHDLETSEKLLISIAVLADGDAAPNILELDQNKGERHADLAHSLLNIDEKVRLPLLGAIIRENL